MEVQMLNCLKRIFAIVAHHSVASLKAQLIRNFMDSEHYVAHQFLILFFHIVKRRYVLLRDYQNVDRCLRVQVMKAYQLIIFLHYVRWYLMLCYAAKNTI